MSEMMTMTAARPAAKKECGCGCSGSATDCCELECLVHPRFFCGQLLADQDLTALVDWIKAKGALARYRHGWGIVCGLDVHCGKGGTITVSPGYAMDCCGRDVVVCDETPFDLAPCWKRPNDPCAAGAAQSAGMASVLWTDVSIPGASPNDVFGFIPKNELQPVDVFIRYSESQSDSRTALARGGCGGAPGCEYTRVHEGFEIYCRPADGCEAAADPWIEWETDYTEGLRKLRGDLDRILKLESPIERLTEYVTRNSPHAFCFIREWLCYLQSTQKISDPKNDAQKADAQKAAVEMRATLAQVAFWIVQDWRNEYLLKPCRGCGPETGIHLARVWMWMRRDSRGKENLTTVYVNAYPPFRRALSNDEWQLPADKVNLAPYVWQPVDTAMQSLRRMGVTPFQKPIEPDLTLVAGQEIILANFGSAGTTQSPLTMYTTFDPHCPTQPRVVGFVRRDATGATDTVPVLPPPPIPATQPPAHETPIATPILAGQPVPNPVTAVEPAPVAPRPRAVDLTKLDGIGDGIANRLRNGGINDAADLAAAQPAAVRTALGNLNVTDARIEEMIAQAKAAVS